MIFILVLFKLFFLPFLRPFQFFFFSGILKQIQVMFGLTGLLLGWLMQLFLCLLFGGRVFSTKRAFLGACLAIPMDINGPFGDLAKNIRL